MSKILTLFRPRKDMDMTAGPITLQLIQFAFPLLIGNLFQQLYNTVDSWVVGNYVSKEAFAAVGAVGPIINMLIGFFLGLSNGAGVLISQYYGAKKHEKVSETVHTFLLMTLILGVLFTFVGLGMTPLMIRFMNTPENVVPESTAYLSIYFAGVIGLMLYNAGAGILRAIGDSQRPFYFLVTSALINIILDLVFVLVFDMGVEGVAWATVISQAVSALMTLIVLFRSTTCVRLSLSKLRIHWDMLAKIIRIGIPSALQMMIISFSNVFVQSYVYAFGDDCMAGWGAYSKIDMIMFLPMQSLSLAVTTFVGQNIGIGQEERARKGVSVAMKITVLITVILMIPLLIFAPYAVQIFNRDPNMLSYGVLFLRHITPFYVICCFNQIYSSALRGAGNTKIPMYIMLFAFVLFRQAYMFVMSNYISNTILPIAMGYPAGWIVCSTITTLYYRKVPLNRKKIITSEE